MKRITQILVIAALAIALTPAVSKADTVNFSGSQGPANANGNVTLAASVTFTTLSGGQLQVTLTNTGTYATSIPAQVLTGVFFSLSGVGTLTPVSGLLASGATVAQCTGANGCTAPIGSNVGGEWAYATANNFPGGGARGISSTGLNWFGAGNFNGPNLQGPVAVDGMQFGLATGTLTPNNGLGKNAVIQSSVVFVLSGLPSGYTLQGNVTNVLFQYGTATNEPSFGGNCVSGCTPPPPPIPEPGTLALFGTGLLGMAGIIRRRMAS